MILPTEIEKLVLGTMFAHPNGTENLPQRVVHELDTSRFDGPAHPHIFSAIKRCVYKKVVPNTANVAIELKGDLDKAGGIEYLESLTKFPSTIGVNDSQGIGDWVREVDLLGRARLIHSILNKKVGIPLEDFQKRVLESDDPEAYLSQLTLEINRYVSGTKSDYQPFSVAVEKFEQNIQASLRGEVTEIIPCGIPNLEKYCIPRPRSFGVISGLSGQGKTQFGIYMAIGTAIDLYNRGENGQVAINTLEQQGDRLAMRVACMMSGVNSLSIAQGKITRQEADRLFEKCAFIKSLPIVYNDDPTITSSQFVTHAICEHLKKPRVLGISDYVELFKDKAESEELRISQATRNIRTVCWETGSQEIMIVQVNDTAVNSSYKVGGMFSSRYSRAPAHAADWFIELVNYPQLAKAQLKASIPDKRNGEMAYALIEKNKDYPIGEEAFEWTAEYTLFRDTSLPVGRIYREAKKEDDF